MNQPENYQKKKMKWKMLKMEIKNEKFYDFEVN